MSQNLPNGNPLAVMPPEIAQQIAAAQNGTAVPAGESQPAVAVDYLQQFEQIEPPPNTPPPSSQPSVVVPPPVHSAPVPQGTPTLPVQPAPTAEDPFDINALLTGVPSTAPQVQAQPQPTAQPVVTPPQTPQVDRDALRTQAMTQLQQQYRLGDDDSRRMLSEPEQVLPKVAAALHVAIAEDMARNIPQMVQNLVQSQIGQALAAQRAELEFFQKYPALGRPEFRPIVEQNLRLAVQSAQGADRNTVMERGARLAALEIRSKFGVQAPQPNAPRPFVPAMPGSGQQPQPPPSSNPFEAMAQEEMRGNELYPW